MIQESRLLLGRCPEDSRLKEVADFAAPHVRYGVDWEALLMLSRERGIRISEAPAHVAYIFCKSANLH